MDKLIVYLLESSAMLVLLYSLYSLLLRNETFFSLNRFFLLAILAFSFLIPLMSFELISLQNSTIAQPIEHFSDARRSYYDALADWGFMEIGNSTTQALIGGRNPSRSTPEGIVMILLSSIYAFGIITIWFRIISAYRWIHQLKKHNPKEVIQGVTVVKVPYQIAPFSFMNSVFVSKDLLGTDEFPQILAHEKTHIQQKHALDLFIVQLLAAVLWFNPVVWMLIKSLKTTHEYIADQKMIKQGYPLVEYQSLLLRQLISNNSFGLVHNFNLSFIKKRITMMKIKESGRTGKVKVAIVLSLVAVLSVVVVQCNSKIDEQLAAPVVASSVTGFASDLVLPTLPETMHQFDYSSYETIEIAIAGDELKINGETSEVSEIGPFFQQQGSAESEAIVMNVDKNQSMSMVREVQAELRKADKRKLVYVGKIPSGKQVKIAFLLPPHPERAEGMKMPTIDYEYVQGHDVDLLKIDLGNHAGSANQEQVYDFVQDQRKRGKSNYVVSANIDDSNVFGDYLINLTYILEGFNQIYDERTQEMFGKRFSDLDRSNKDENEQYMAVRQGIPKAVLVSERD